jgi:hypothetical protein
MPGDPVNHHFATADPDEAARPVVAIAAEEHAVRLDHLTERAGLNCRRSSEIQTAREVVA